MRYLHEEGFDWIEPRSIVRRDTCTRYRKVDGRIEQEETDHLTAAHVFTSTHEQRPGGVSVQRLGNRELPQPRHHRRQRRLSGAAAR